MVDRVNRRSSISLLLTACYDHTDREDLAIKLLQSIAEVYLDQEDPPTGEIFCACVDCKITNTK